MAARGCGSININSCRHSLEEVALRGQDRRFNVLKSESGCKGTLTLLSNPEKEGHGEAPGEHRGRSMKRLSGKGMELSESPSAVCLPVRAGAELRAVGREQFHGESRKVWKESSKLWSQPMLRSLLLGTLEAVVSAPLQVLVSTGILVL